MRHNADVDNAPDQRIGDRERRAVDDRLQRAAGEGQLTLAEYGERSGQLWQARTRGDLESVTADLPPEASPPAPVAGQRARRVWAVLAENRMVGATRPGQQLQATGILGTAYVDLRQDDLPAHVDLRAVAVLGQVVVLVRPDVTVRLSGASFLGSREVELPGHAPATPMVDVAAYAVLGGVLIRVTPDSALTQAGGQLPARRERPRRRTLRRALVAAALAVGIGAGGVAVAGHSSDGRAVFGSTVVRATTKDSIDVGVLFGSVTVVVPDNARVENGGSVVFGSVNCDQACDLDRGGRVIHVTGSGGFGSVEIVTQSEYQASRDSGDGS